MDDQKTNENIPVSDSTLPVVAPQISTVSPDPETHNREKIVLVVVFIFLVATIGVLSFLLVNEKFTKTDNATETAKPLLDIQEKITSTDQKKLKIYSSEEYGFSFNYPEDWGSVAESKQEEEKGSVMKGTFSKQKQVFFSVASKDAILFGRDGGCAFSSSFGVTEDRPIADYKVKEENSTLSTDDDKDSKYRIIGKVVFEEDNKVINESFEAGTAEGPGMCLGYYSNSFVLFSPTNTSRGVAFFYGTVLNNVPEIPTDLADEYLDSPYAFYDESVRSDYIDMVKTTSALF